MFKSVTSRRVCAIMVSSVCLGLAPQAASAVEVTAHQGGPSIHVADHVYDKYRAEIDTALKTSGADQHIQITDHRAVNVKDVAPQSQSQPQTRVVEPVAKSAASSTGQRIADIALSKVGSAYVYGAAGPSSFDCSGFTSWVHAQAGISIPRTSQAQAAGGKQVSVADMQPGDIISYYGGASHVAIYIGNGQMVDALNSNSGVGVRPVNYMPINNVVRYY